MAVNPTPQPVAASRPTATPYPTPNRSPQSASDFPDFDHDGDKDHDSDGHDGHGGGDSDDLLYGAGAAAAAGIVAGAALWPFGAKPNIIVIQSDDQGWGEVRAQWEASHPTPQEDSIAKNGVRFTNGYVTCPDCAPSHIGLLTGRYEQRFGYEDSSAGLAKDEKILPEKLKRTGYVTGLIGRWDVDDQARISPTDRGFDEFFGFFGSGHTYLADSKEKSPEFTGPIIRGSREVQEDEYLTDAFAREAVSFIKRHAAEPFFLYIPFNAPNAPLEASQKYLDRFPEITDPDQKTRAAMLAALDDAVGNVLEAVRKYSIEQKTLIFYLSDNGATQLGSNGPLRQRKGDVYEGGIRVPFLMQWKGVVPQGRVYSKPVTDMDIHATALAAAGLAAPARGEIDGVNLLPYVTGKDQSAPHEALCWRHAGKRAFRQGDWKLVQEDPSKDAELYNIANDMGETNNLAKQNPEKLRELEKAYQVLNAQMKEPGKISARPAVDSVEKAAGGI